MVFVGGLSMGSLLAIYLGAHYVPRGTVLYSPAVKVSDPLIHLSPVLKHVIAARRKSGRSDLTDPDADRRKWSYDVFPAAAGHELLKLIRRSRDLLPQVTSPLLIVHSSRDRMIRSNSAEFTYRRAGSADKTLVTLHQSGHVLTVDSEWETVAERSYVFIQAHLTGRS
jgi:carboxylesterase